jgi:hypothetical protein
MAAESATAKLARSEGTWDYLIKQTSTRFYRKRGIRTKKKEGGGIKMVADEARRPQKESAFAASAGVYCKVPPT